MPKLVVLAACCRKELVLSMSGFMEEWEKAEDRMSDSALALLDNVTEKDRGLLLHWLLTECDLPVAALAVPAAPCRDSYRLRQLCCSLNRPRPNATDGEREWFSGLLTETTLQPTKIHLGSMGFRQLAKDIRKRSVWPLQSL
jgi:hypothetical protein